MKQADQIHSDIQKRFEDITKKKIQEGTVIDFYTVATSDALEGAYKEIEDNKTPHIYTGIKGTNLDDFGFFVNCPRFPEESDEQYLYRIMEWKLKSEASNTTAIQNELLSLEFASNADYIPLTNGCGTASVYITPRNYNDDTIRFALQEVKDRIASIVSPSLYIEYIIPTIIPVRIHAFMQSQNGDLDLIRQNLENKIGEYINRIPPKQYLKIGLINRMGVNEPMVDFFNILQLSISDKEAKEIEILQRIETKFILDEIIWV